MKTKSKKLIIFGDSAFAEVAYEYFTHDSEYEVVAFTVSRDYLKQNELFDLPVIPFENVEAGYRVDEFEMFVAMTYRRLNRDRAKIYCAAKEKGYKLANYVSSKAFIWPNVRMGDNCFIFENNVIQPFVVLGSNVILWSGNHIGHHSKIHNHCFLASQVVVSGFVEIGEHCFIGVNATIANNLRIADDCLIGAGAMIVKNTLQGELYKGQRSIPDPVSVYEKFEMTYDEVD
ncbi:MAG: acetyltransferase [bacterium]